MSRVLSDGAAAQSRAARRRRLLGSNLQDPLCTCVCFHFVSHRLRAGAVGRRLASRYSDVNSLIHACRAIPLIA